MHIKTGEDMVIDEYEYNNPFNIVKKMESEFESRGGEIKDIQYDKNAFRSWIIKFSMDGSKYRFLWDGKNNWLILDSIVIKKGRTEWEDLEIFKHNQPYRTKKDQIALERDIIENMLLSLDKLYL